MKNTLLTILLFALLLSLSGCFMMPAKPSDAVAGVGGQAEIPAATAPDAPKPPEASAQDIIAQVATVKKEEAVVNVTNETNITVAEELKISGSLTLQDTLSLCPHLQKTFSCDKYDLRRCTFKTLVGQNDFYPDLIGCRSGYDYRKEDPNHKYCYMQECMPIEKGGIVESYGGIVAYAEYLYKVEQTEGGIMTYYTLNNCGEERKEFKTSFDCRIYKSELKNI